MINYQTLQHKHIQEQLKLILGEFDIVSIKEQKEKIKEFTNKYEDLELKRKLLRKTKTTVTKPIRLNFTTEDTIKFINEKGITPEDYYNQKLQDYYKTLADLQPLYKELKEKYNITVSNNQQIDREISKIDMDKMNISLQIKKYEGNCITIGELQDILNDSLVLNKPIKVI
jgi:hypothetical protein